VRGPDRFGDLLLDTLRKTGVTFAVCSAALAPSRAFSTSNVTRDGQRTFFGSRGAISLCVLHTFLPARFFHQLPRILWVTAFSIRDLKKSRGRSCASFIHAANGFLSMWDGAEQANSQENPPTAPAGRSSVCKQRRSRHSSRGGATRASLFWQFERAGTRENRHENRKTGLPDLDGGILREVPSFAVRAVDSTGAGDAFTAAFLQARMRGWSTLEAALAANAAGAAAASRVGAGERCCRMSRGLLNCCARSA